MTTILDGGPEFPVPNGANVNDQDGMSLRDWFAGQALAGLAAHPQCDLDFLDTAKAAYQYADKMLAARGWR